ncbi:monovalent cation/H+ antiporter complex subunit F [Clostridiaceae bacterium HSG29]|nr:monovalent cation/H+ antiporter complex subunit F [Clostridiaceae bacterium HSG29]
MLNTTLVVLCFALTVSFYRFLMGKNIWDRLLNLNLVSVKILMIFTVYSIHVHDLNLLDTSLTFVIVSFLVVVLISRFIISGGDTK